MSLQNTKSEKKELEVEKDYGFVFGLSADNGQSMVYKGDNVWIGRQGDQTQEIKCANTSAKVLGYINKGF